MDKLAKLKEILMQMKSVLVAYSGGVDSTFLLKVAKDTLGDRVLAVTAESETYTAKELENAKKVASEFGVKHLIIHTNEINDKQFASNPHDRCYFCKKALFSNLQNIAREYNMNFVVDGSNLDDTEDYRPGSRAGKEFGVRSPMLEAEISKQEIRDYSKKMGLSTWNKPSNACLSSRFPYGEQITLKKLEMVASAEDFLQKLGFNDVRVRYYTPSLARIELGQQETEKIFSDDLHKLIILHFKKIGFKYITVDLEGYRTGSMNDVL